MSSELEDKFRQAKQSGGGFVRVNASHSVDLFVGIDEGRRSVLLLCETEPKGLPIIDAVEFKKRARDDHRWALVVALKRPELSGLFAYLCSDLVEATTQADSGDLAVAALVERMKWWQRLLSKGRSSLLEETALRGLVSELLFLADHAIPELGALAAVSGWAGPFEAPRDFKFDSIDVEVKSVRRDGTEIRVTSLEQLDETRAGVPVAIAVIALERVQQPIEGAFSCADLVRRLRLLCEHEDSAVQSFDERLWLAGYTDHDDYASVWFVGKPFRFFACPAEFPKILRKDVPAGIVGCSYDVGLAAIERFSIPTWNIAP